MSLKRDIKMPDEVGFIFRVLNSAGFEAFIVGGCVRDSLMGENPGDWDITTNARPHEVKYLFKKTIDTGIKHGTVTVVISGLNFEVTTYRIDGSYMDNRHPENIEFISSLKEDLSRRDFTMNSIAYHPDRGFIDLFGGIKDIECGNIRAVGDADERFKEDALRMLRAVRFSAQLGFQIEQRTLNAIIENRKLVQSISCERVRDELTKTLVSLHPEKFVLLRETGLLSLLLPEVDACFDIKQNNPYHAYDIAAHSLKAVGAIDNAAELRWTMLLHDTGKVLTKTIDDSGVDHFYGHQLKSAEIAQGILKRLKFDNKTIDRVLRLVKHHDRQVQADLKAVRRAVNTVGKDIFEDFLKVRQADIKAQKPELEEERLHKLNTIKMMYQSIIEKEQCVDIKDLKINGDDLLSMGCPQGKKIRIVLEKLLEMVLEKPELNTRETLIKLSAKFI